MEENWFEKEFDSDLTDTLNWDEGLGLLFGVKAPVAVELRKKYLLIQRTKDSDYSEFNLCLHQYRQGLINKLINPFIRNIPFELSEMKKGKYKGKKIWNINGTITKGELMENLYFMMCLSVFMGFEMADFFDKYEEVADV